MSANSPDEKAASRKLALAVFDDLVSAGTWKPNLTFRRERLVETFEKEGIHEEALTGRVDAAAFLRLRLAARHCTIVDDVIDHLASKLHFGEQQTPEPMEPQQPPQAQQSSQRTRRPRWKPWQVGPKQFGLPDTVPGSDHTGLKFACFTCGGLIIEGGMVHQLKVSAVWSKCLLDTVRIGTDQIFNKAKQTYLKEVFCCGCGTPIGAAYMEPYCDSEMQGPYPAKSFPCIKFKHVIKKKDGWLKNSLILIGEMAEVRRALDGLSTTDMYDRSEGHSCGNGTVRPALSMRTYDVFHRNNELAEEVRQLQEQLDSEKGRLEHFEKRQQQLADEEMKLREERQLLEEEQTSQRQELNAERRHLLEQFSERERQLDDDKRQLEEDRWEFENLADEERRKRAQAERERDSMARQMELRIKEVDEENKRAKSAFELTVKQEREALELERLQMEEQLRSLGTKTAQLEEKARAGPEAKMISHIETCRMCKVYQAAERAFMSIGIDERLLDRLYDRCYCRVCYLDIYPDVISNDGPNDYVVPRGWVRFGLKVPAHADVNDIWKKWCVSFHGTKRDVAKSIIGMGDFLMPGDKMPDGGILGSVNCAGRTDRMTYTSPTVNYAGLAFYANPVRGPGGTKFQVVFQCRQKPDTFTIQPETMGFRQLLQRDLCPHVSCDKIEWVTQRRKSIIPYGVLIRSFPEDSPPKRFYRSPVDRGRF